MEPWWKFTMPRKEVRDGQSFNPDEFAIAQGASKETEGTGQMNQAEEDTMSSDVRHLKPEPRR